MSSSNSNATLLRYRPAILAFTVLAAGYTVYCVRSSFWALSSSPSGQPLHRRNAIHRRNRQTPNTQSLLSTSRSVINASAAVEQFRVSPLEYGVFSTTIDGQFLEYSLTREGLRDGSRFTRRFPDDPEASFDLREEYEEALLSAFFASTFPDDTVLVDVAGAETFLNAFEAEGFLISDAISVCILRFNNGDLDRHPMRIARLEQDEPVRDIERLRELQREANEMDFRIETSQNRDLGPESPTTAIHASDMLETVVDGESEHSWHGGDDNDESRKEGQSLLNLLYHIAEDQARRDGYAHRGVTCNSCNVMPIRGIRYRCTNCVDYDLCEQCEALQIHPKTHLFYKVRIPAPFLGNPRQPQPVWYPGRSFGLAPQLNREMSKRFCESTGFELPEVDALWDQFKCLVSTDWQQDPNGFGVAIDRKTFDKCFVPSTSIRPPPPNLIYDRMFSFYDTNGDGYIGFEEFLKGLSTMKSKNLDEQIKRIFRGYDLDSDGYVSRKDFLYMFRAFYALSKELIRDMVAGMEEDVLEGGGQRDFLLGSQPISSAYSGAIPGAEASRFGEGKTVNNYGDLEVTDGIGAVKESERDEGDHHEVIGDVSERATFGNVENTPRGHFDSMIADEPPNDQTFDDRITLVPESVDAGLENSDMELETDTNRMLRGLLVRDEETSDDMWPPEYVHVGDVERALGYTTLPDNIMSRADRKHILAIAMLRSSGLMSKARKTAREAGIEERWRRRQYYLVEEDGDTAPTKTTELSNEAVQSSSVPSLEKSELAPSLANGTHGLESANTINGYGVEDVVERRKAAMNAIRQSSSLLRSLRSSTRGEIRRRSSRSIDEEEIITTVDLLITMARKSIGPDAIASSLSQIEGGISEPHGFVEWFIDRIFVTEKELQTPSKYARSRRSRSSSKVRFQDEDMNTDLETRSNTSISSRSIPVGERWGGYEVPIPEQDAGREILYQITQEGLNELLDPLFKQREDLGMEAQRTKSERAALRDTLDVFADSKMQTLVHHQVTKFQKKWRTNFGDNRRVGLANIDIGEELRTIISREHEPGTTEHYHNIEDMCRYGIKVPTELTSKSGEPGGESFLNGIASGDKARPTNCSLPSLSPAPSPIKSGISTPPATEPEYPEAVLDLHSAVTAFNEADPSIEEKIMQESLQELLQNSGYAAIIEEPPDPTLPQNRPNSISPEPLSSDPESTAASDEMSTSQDFQDKLKFMTIMDCIEKEDVTRGGPGRLSFNEFEEIMKGRKGGRLGFLGLWIEMASF